MHIDNLWHSLLNLNHIYIVTQLYTLDDPSSKYVQGRYQTLLIHIILMHCLCPKMFYNVFQEAFYLSSDLSRELGKVDASDNSYYHVTNEVLYFWIVLIQEHLVS